MNKLLGLKVKIKTAQEEAKLIRREERKQAWWYKTSKVKELVNEEEANEIIGTRQWLHDHRVKVLRPATRSTLLAYAYLRGRPVDKVESQLTTTSIDVKSIERMVKEYGPAVSEQIDFITWSQQLINVIVLNRTNLESVEICKADKRRKKRESQEARRNAPTTGS